jgi:hypothetical protein
MLSVPLDPGQAGWLGSLTPDHAAIIAEAHAREGGRRPSSNSSGDGGQPSTASGSTTTGSGVFLAPPSSHSDDELDPAAAATLDPSQFTATNFGFFGDGGNEDTVRKCSRQSHFPSNIWL